MQLLEGVVEAVKKDGSKAPVLAVDPEFAAKLAKRKELRAALESCKRDLEQIDAELFPKAEHLRLDLSRQTGRPVGSVKLGVVSYITYHNVQARYAWEDACDIEKKFGTALFEKYFQPKYWIDGLDVKTLPAELLAQIKAHGGEVKFTVKALPILELDRTMDEHVNQLAATCGVQHVAYFK
mgnify:CR=1 FL=1